MHHFIQFSQLLVRCTLSSFLELKKLIINHSCDKWMMVYCSLGLCGTYLVIYNRILQARKVLILSAEMEQTLAEPSHCRDPVQGNKVT